MTVPAGLAVSAIALTVYREWERLTNELAVAVAQLAAAVGDRKAVEAAAMVPRVESLLQQASNAAKQYATYKLPVAPEVQQRWVSVLTRMQSALNGAKALKGTASAAPIMLSDDGGVMPPSPLDAGFRIPGTNVVVPWVAVVGVAAVVLAGVYFSRRRK